MTDKKGYPIDRTSFILDLTHDVHARVALRAYADSCVNDQPSLYDHLNDLLANICHYHCEGGSYSSHPNDLQPCSSPAVIALYNQSQNSGHRAWVCIDHARQYPGLCKEGKDSLARRLAKAKT